jgi:CRISPR/Cas system CSM-associated protein Csm3 (group 7 of RAMP superfamily)
MSRKIQTRWKINGILTAETPIHIGGIGGNADTDLALAVNGCGEYYIPGTSLAGALRGWMSQPFSSEKPQDQNDTNTLKHPDNPVNKLWGFQEENKGHASFIIIEDAVIEQHNMTIEIREGVGIDRYTGAAAENFKYSRAILPKGVTFTLDITLDCQTDDKPKNLWQLLRALEESDIRIGAAKTRGLGKIKLSEIEIEEHNFSSSSGLFNSLLKQNINENWHKIKQELEKLQPYQPLDKLTLTISWKPKDPVMVKAEGDGIAVDILPLVSQANQKAYFVIPGSSIKGVLRSHAERIVRTLLDFNCPEKFDEQIKLNLINEIFGSAEKNKSKNQGKMGALSIDDCYATIEMESENWSKVENAQSMAVNEFKPLVNAAINTTEDRYTVLQPAMHVAVDRWTGGAADGMLYSVLEPIGVDWDSIGIHLDLERLKRYEKDNIQPAIALLLLVLRDFANRKIPIGYGTNRGMGTVEVTKIKFNCSEVEGLEGIERTKPVEKVSQKTDSFLEELLGQNLIEKLNQFWQQWNNSVKNKQEETTQ